MESIVSDQPVWAAQADLKQHFTQTSESPFSRVAPHISYISHYKPITVFPLSIQTGYIGSVMS